MIRPLATSALRILLSSTISNSICTAPYLPSLGVAVVTVSSGIPPFDCLNLQIPSNLDDINILIYSDNHRRRETIHDICLSWVKKTGSKILSRKIRADTFHKRSEKGCEEPDQN
jgi:hypothetical protein